MKKGELIERFAIAIKAESIDDVLLNHSHRKLLGIFLNLARQLEEPKVVKVKISSFATMKGFMWSLHDGNGGCGTNEYFMTEEEAIQDAKQFCDNLGLVAKIEEEK